MPKTTTISASTTKITDERVEGTLNSIQFLSTWLDAPTILAFSITCKTVQRMAVKGLTKHLLTAVVCGDEYSSKKIIRAYPELLLDSSATTVDLSRKIIKNLTPLQAAICAGDVDMVDMIKQVLQQKIDKGIKLNFDPMVEIQRQILTIYPDGIDVVENNQRLRAEGFKNNILNELLTVFNVATDEQIKFELMFPGLTIPVIEEDVIFEHENPGSVSPRIKLNTALNNFRAQFTVVSTQEVIFNPFYLLKAYEFYDEQFNNFFGIENNENSRRDLFWRQIIGYIQRHLPACYLQAFAQGVYYIAENNEKLKRDFEFRHCKEFSMLPWTNGFLNDLGFRWLALVGGPGSGKPTGGAGPIFISAYLDNFLQTKKLSLESLRVAVATTHIKLLNL